MSKKYNTFKQHSSASILDILCGFSDKKVKVLDGKIVEVCLNNSTTKLKNYTKNTRGEVERYCHIEERDIKPAGDNDAVNIDQGEISSCFCVIL